MGLEDGVSGTVSILSIPFSSGSCRTKLRLITSKKLITLNNNHTVSHIGQLLPCKRQSCTRLWRAERAQPSTVPSNSVTKDNQTRWAVKENPAAVMRQSPKRSASQHVREVVCVLLLSTHRIGGDHLLHFRLKKQAGREGENEGIGKGQENEREKESTTTRRTID